MCTPSCRHVEEPGRTPWLLTCPMGPRGTLSLLCPELLLQPLRSGTEAGGARPCPSCCLHPLHPAPASEDQELLVRRWELRWLEPQFWVLKACHYGAKVPRHLALKILCQTPSHAPHAPPARLLPSCGLWLVQFPVEAAGWSGS